MDWGYFWVLLEVPFTMELEKKKRIRGKKKVLHDKEVWGKEKLTMALLTKILNLR